MSTVEDSKARSIKTGLKQILDIDFVHTARIRKQDPLKQGLKPLIGFFLGFLVVFESKIH